MRFTIVALDVDSQQLLWENHCQFFCPFSYGQWVGLLWHIHLGLKANQHITSVSHTLPAPSANNWKKPCQCPEGPDKPQMGLRSPASITGRAPS